MSRVDPHERYEELAVGHALAALEPEDEQVFLAHLRGCSRCAEAVAEHEQTLAQLALESDAGDPPPALLQRIMAEVEQTSVPLVGTQRSSSERAGHGDEPVRLDEVRARRRLGATPAARRRAATWLGAAAALALIATLGVSNAALQRDRDESRGLSERLAQAVRTLEDDGARSVVLRTPSGTIAAVAVVRGGEMSLLVDGLPPNDAESTTYVLWEKGRFGDVRAVGAFDVRGDQMDVVNGMRLPGGDLSGVAAFAVTREQGNTAPPLSNQPPLAVGTPA